jgi:hypothetical protein
MLGKPLEQISTSDLIELVDDKCHEGKLIDFKAEMWRIDKDANPNVMDRDKQVVEFLVRSSFSCSGIRSGGGSCGTRVR